MRPVDPHSDATGILAARPVISEVRSLVSPIGLGAIGQIDGLIGTDGLHDRRAAVFTYARGGYPLFVFFR